MKKVIVGEWEPVDLGEGDHARWGPRGGRIAVRSRGTVFVMDADGKGRRELVAIGGNLRNCPIEFHSNGEEVIYATPRDGLWAVRIDS